jgi:O-antigen ligase
MTTLRQENTHLLKLSLQHWQLVFVTIMLFTGSISIAVTQMALGVSLVLQLVRWLGKKEPLPPIRMHVAVGLLAAWALLMIPFSGDSSQSMLFYRRFYLFAALWVTAGVAVSEFNRKILLGSLIGGSAIISIAGMAKVVQETGGLFTTRLGEMSNPMTSGCLLMLALLACLGVVLTRGVSWRSRAIITVAASPVFLGLLHTMTRSAWLGLMAGVMAMIFFVRPRFFLGLFVICVLGLIFLPAITDLVLSEKAASRVQWDYILNGRNTTLRLDMWRGGWEMIKSHPLTGVGDRDLLSVSAEYYGDENTSYYGHLHSNPVMFAVIWGVPGFVLAMGLLGWMAFLLVKGYREKRLPPWATGWLLGAIGAWVAFFVAGLTEWYFGDAESMQFFLAITGIALGGIFNKTGEKNV